MPTSVAFQSGDTKKSFTFATTDDDLDDDGESVVLSFGDILPTGVTAVSASTVSIDDDDDPQVTVGFGAASYMVAEGDAVEVTVTLSANPEREVTIPLTTTPAGGATNADYSGVPAKVVFTTADWNVPQTFNVTASNDDEDDDEESVRLEFGAPPAGVTAGSATTVSIVDNDDPQVTADFGQAAYTIDEGGIVEVTVTLDADPEREVTIPLTGTPQNGATTDDYSGVPASVVFQSGDTGKSFTFRATEDQVDDDGESVALGFGDLPEGVTAGSVASSTVSITDDDTAGITLSRSAFTVAEGSSESYTVALDSEPTVQVNVTVSGHSGTDLTLSGTLLSVDKALTFTTDNWSTPQRVTVAAAEDDDSVADSVTLTHDASGGDYGSITATLAVTIADSDTAGITVSPTELHIGEGNSGEYMMVLETEPSADVTVTITGHAGTDLTLSPDGLTFTTDAWNTPQTVTATAGEDDDAAPDADVTLSHTLNGGDYTGVAADSVTVTIYENDPVIPPDQGPGNRIITYPPPAGVTVDPLQLTIQEGESGSYTVGLDSAPSSSVTVTVKVPEDADLTVSPDSLTLTPDNWETAQTVTVSAAEDDDAIADEAGISHDITRRGLQHHGHGDGGGSRHRRRHRWSDHQPQRPDSRRGEQRELHGGAGYPAFRRRDGGRRRRFGGRIGQPHDPDLYDRQLEHDADGDGERR